MYSTCIFCNGRLGANEVVEHFPVGRRLAFDAAKGRLWVVCARCARWNLTPLEERWEAIEECERLFRDTRLRASTSKVGLARLREGTELVRIGSPQRPEFAAWRYGDQFGRRRRKQMLMFGGAGVAIAGAVVAGPLMGLAGMGALASLYTAIDSASLLYQSHGKVRVPLDDTEVLQLKRSEFGRALLIGGLTDDPEGAWQLHIVPSGLTGGWKTHPVEPTRVLTGTAAMRAIGAILPAVNRGGGGRSVVQQAVAHLEEIPTPYALFARVAAAGRARIRGRPRVLDHLGPPQDLPASFRLSSLENIPLHLRLALEMSAHEERERRALDGELADLERAWREADEVAAIADDLLLPTVVDARVRRLRGGGSAGE